MVRIPDSKCSNPSPSPFPLALSASESTSPSPFSPPPMPIPTPNPTPDPRMPDQRASSPSASDLDNPPVPDAQLWEGMVSRLNDLPRECEEVSRLGRVYGPSSGGGERNGGGSNSRSGGGGGADCSGGAATGSGGGGAVGTAGHETARRDSESSGGQFGHGGRESGAEDNSSFIARTSSERGSVKDETSSELRGRTCRQSAVSMSSTSPPPSASSSSSTPQGAQSQPESQSHTRVGRSFRPPFTKPSHMPFKGLHRSFPSCDDLHQGYDTDVP